MHIFCNIISGFCYFKRKTINLFSNLTTLSNTIMRDEEKMPLFSDEFFIYYSKLIELNLSKMWSTLVGSCFKNKLKSVDYRP